jgi:hypothetical protein
MRRRAFSVPLAFMGALLIGASGGRLAAQQPTPLPFARSLSMYVGHRGTWLNYGSGQQERAEIEDPLAAFRAAEPVGEDPDQWAYCQINDPQVPNGWTFFTPVGDRPMKLHVIVRDAQGRLGGAEISDRDTGISFGTVPAKADGSHIDGCLPVPPTREAFTLLVRGKDNGTILFRAATNNPRIADVVVIAAQYDWEPNKGEEHDCPIVPPSRRLWGALGSAEGKRTGHPDLDTRACAGPLEFTNDTPYVVQAEPKYPLREKQVVKDTTTTFEDKRFTPQAQRHLRTALAAVRKSWEGSPVLPLLELPPFSRGIGHWPAGLEGQMKAVVCFPYRGRRSHRPHIARWLEVCEVSSPQSGIGQQAPSQAVAAAIADTWGPYERMAYQSQAPIAIGDVWGLRAWSGGTPDGLTEAITTPVTFELWGDMVAPPPGAPGRLDGRGTAAVVEPWTDARPPHPAFGDMGLSFSDPDSWRWKATGEPSPRMAYSKGEVGPFEVPGNDTVRIVCHLEKLLCLKIKTASEGGEHVQANVELEQQVEGGIWTASWVGETTRQPNGEQVWAYSLPLSPGTYRARARAGKGPYSEWHQFDVAIGIEQIEGVTVPQG